MRSTFSHVCVTVAVAYAIGCSAKKLRDLGRGVPGSSVEIGYKIEAAPGVGGAGGDGSVDLARMWVEERIRKYGYPKSATRTGGNLLTISVPGATEKDKGGFER